MAALFRTSDDWDLGTGWEPELNARRVYLPRGKVLGGSSSINAMIYIRGNRADWDDWAAEGCTGWSYDEVLPYFKRAEDNARGADEFHGAGGPLTVSDQVVRGELSERFLAACAAQGIPANPDFNAASQDGVGWYQTTTRDGKRCSTAVAYLHPAMDRPNLTVQTWVHASKVLIEGGRAVGVQGLRLGEVLEFRAEREVIVSAGAYLSPQLLTLSGIGRPDELELLQVPLAAESPAMGLGLSDHPNSGVSCVIEQEISLKDALTDEALGEWMGGGGVLTTNPAPVGGFVRTREGLDHPDVQLHFVPAMFEQEGLVPPPAHGFTVAACVLKPRSRGQVAVTSPDPTAKPFIVHNYLADPVDFEAQVAGVELALELCDQGPLAELGLTPHMFPARAHARRRRAPRPPDAADDLPPRRHVPHGLRRPLGRRPGAAGARRRGPARRRRVRLPGHAARQHERPDDLPRRARGGPHPRDGGPGRRRGHGGAPRRGGRRLRRRRHDPDPPGARRVGSPRAGVRRPVR